MMLQVTALRNCRELCKWRHNLGITKPLIDFINPYQIADDIETYRAVALGGISGCCDATLVAKLKTNEARAKAGCSWEGNGGICTPAQLQKFRTVNSIEVQISQVAGLAACTAAIKANVLFAGLKKVVCKLISGSVAKGIASYEQAQG